MTKFIIRDGNKLFLKERTHVDNMFLGSSFRETDLRTEMKPDSIKKIFENPITAIAYDTTHYQHNIEMDKKSLTKALDFWINDKVLQNEKILFIEGKLDDVHEIELKNLIELREFVQKQDNDTVFTRFRGSDSKKYDFTKKSSWGVEFFVKRELVPNNITYNYRDLFMGDGARWDFGGLNSDDISFQLFGGRHSDGIFNAFTTTAEHTSEALNDLSRALSRSNGAGTDVTQGDPNPYNWRVSRMGNGVTFGLFDQTDALIRVNDTFMNNFPSASAAEESRRQHRIVWDRRHERQQQRLLLPSDTVTEIVGEAEERLSPGDLITMNPNTRRWRKAVMANDTPPFLVNVRPVAFGEIVEAVREGSFTVNVGSEPRLRTEPEHPSLPTFQAPSNNNNNNRIQDITFENLTIHPVSETMEAGENIYIMTTYAAQNGQYEMTFDLYVTGREIDRISEGFRTHTLRIEEDRERGRMEIDGELYYYVNYTIRERIREVDIEKRFTNMYLKEIASRARALAQEHPFIYELTFENPEDGVEMEMGIIRSATAFENPSDGVRVFNDIIMELRNGRLHNIRILPGSDRLIQIGRYRFRLDGQPVRVTWSSR